MEISNGVKMIELQIEAFGGRQELNPTLIWDADCAVLIDTGTPGNLEQIRTAMNSAGIPFEKLKVIILTHHDIDHIGSLPEILQEANSNIEVYAHEIEGPYIEGKLSLLKANLDSMAWQLEELSADKRQEVVAQVNSSPRAKVDKTLFGGEELPFCGGIQVIFLHPGIHQVI